jgi:hypothetical protein
MLVIPTLVFYQLVLIALVWLFLTLYWLWPTHPAAGCQRIATPAPPRRERSREPTPFAGLTQKPPCAACEQEVMHPKPVGSKNSCGLAVVVLEQPAEPFATLNRAFTLLVLAGRRKEHDVALPLVWAFFMVMGDILVKGMPQRLLPKQDQPRQRFVLDGADPSFRVSI